MASLPVEYQTLVKTWMAQDVIQAHPWWTVAHVQRVMIEHDFTVPPLWVPTDVEEAILGRGSPCPRAAGAAAVWARISCTTQCSIRVGGRVPGEPHRARPDAGRGSQTLTITPGSGRFDRRKGSAFIQGACRR